MATQTAAPRKGKPSASSLKLEFDDDVGGDGGDEDPGDDAETGPVDFGIRWDHRSDGREAMLLERGGNPKISKCHARGDIGMEDILRSDAGNPHHGGRGIAHHAAGAAGVGGRHDGREIADMHP